MRTFPKINDKFYNAGFTAAQQGGTFRGTIESMVAIEEAADKADTPDKPLDYREVDSRTFSRFLGFLDGALQRLRR